LTAAGVARYEMNAATSAIATVEQRIVASPDDGTAYSTRPLWR